MLLTTLDWKHIDAGQEGHHAIQSTTYNPDLLLDSMRGKYDNQGEHGDESSIDQSTWAKRALMIV